MQCKLIELNIYLINTGNSTFVISHLAEKIKINENTINFALQGDYIVFIVSHKTEIQS